MRKLILSFVCIACNILLLAQVPSTIELNRPNLERGSTVMKAFSQRASATEFDTTQISLNDLSDLLWAANGINRAEKMKRTAPSAYNDQDIDVYVVLKSGAYLYNALDHTLDLVVEGDYRKEVAGTQSFVAKAPLICVLVSDISRFRNGTDENKMDWAKYDSGIVSQNISLFCAGMGLKTRPRVGMNREKLHEALKLTDSQFLMMNNPISY